MTFRCNQADWLCIVVGAAFFFLATNAKAQSIYKCRLPNGQIEYTDMHCTGNSGKVIKVVGASKQFSNMSLQDLHDREGRLVLQLESLNTGMYHEIRSARSKLGMHPTNEALTESDKSIRAVWDPKLQATKNEILSVAAEIRHRCASGAAWRESNHICR